MKTPRLVAVLVSLAVIALLAADASAMYHPTMGRFLQRDPGPDGIMGAPRVGTAGPAVGGGFIPRDQYADGMNLYQYVNSAPTVRVDPTGLKVTDCGVKVHRILPTKMEGSTLVKSDIGHTWLEYKGKTTGFVPARPAIQSPDKLSEDMMKLLEEEGEMERHKSWGAPVDSSAWFRRMKKGSGAEKKCACVTCEEVYDCLDKVAEEWKKVRWNFETANCRHFVRSALKDCCLNYPISDHPIRKGLRALTIIGLGPLGALIPLPEIEEGDI